jgi:tRNA threonylcarbamoyl adenosine modification protein YeaZ
LVKLLAIDTSGPTCILAVHLDGEEAEVKIEFDKSKNEALKQSVAGLLSDFGLRPDMLTHIAVGVGPGKFIRLRTGISFANGLASSIGVPIVQVDSLAVLGYSCIADPKKIAAVREGGKGKVFFAVGLKDSEDPLFDPRTPWKYGPSETTFDKLCDSAMAYAELIALDDDAQAGFQQRILVPGTHFAHVHSDAKVQAFLRLAIEGVRRNRFCAIAVPRYGDPIWK